MAVLSEWCIKFTFRDAKGQTRSIKICYASDAASIAANAAAFQTAIAATQTALANMSNAHVSSEALLNGNANQRGVTYGTSAEYNSVADQAHLYYLTLGANSDQGKGTLTIPAPKAAIFEADQVTVNPGNALVTALNVALNIGGDDTAGAVAVGPLGYEYETFVGGLRIARKVTRKFNKYTKDPTLTIAGV